MTNQEIVERKKKEILEIATSNGVTKISLFGSAVRREDKENSDIDFLVEFDEGRSLFDLIQLKHELEELLQKPVDVVTKNALHQRIREQIILEAVQL
ncbi:MAG: nucleotidyltransferase family protein [Bacillota bacterium]|nr:nucleotidyltransferase family protein [Bacillota bacterium]